MATLLPIHFIELTITLWQQRPTIRVLEDEVIGCYRLLLRDYTYINKQFEHIFSHF
jgi:hypothetical protein